MIRSPQRQLAPDDVGPGLDETTSLRGIADKARHDKAHRFGNLYGELNEALLKEAWRGLNKSAASGIDRVMARDYEQELDANIEDLVERLKGKRYRARAVRRHYIPKTDGTQRPLGIPVVEDKLLQAGVAMILEVIYEPDFLPASFGYRPGVGARDAVQALGFNLQYGRFGYVVEADIQGFFSHLNHDGLQRMLRERIADESFIGLIGQWLKAGVLEPDGSFLYPEAGTPQGGVVSPILANIYLHHGLDLWFEEVVKPHCRGKALLIRYADDFVCAFQYLEDAEAFYRVLPKRLAKFGLEVAPEKTRLLRFSRFHPGMRRRFAFLGFEFYWSVDRQGERRLMKRTARKKLGRALKAFSDWVRTHRHLPTKELFRQVAWKLRGHFNRDYMDGCNAFGRYRMNYFGLPGNSRSIMEFHAKVLATLLKWLKRRNRRHRMNGGRFYRLVDLLRLPQPRIVSYPRTRSIVLA